MYSKYLYLSIDFLTLFFTIAFSFLPLNKFYKQWRFLFPAIFITALVFILWDILFTSMKVWSFNPNYILGIYLFNLPIEEVLFFISIPYACVFTYHSISILIPTEISTKLQDRISTVIMVLLFIIGILNFHRWYTFVTFVSTAFFMLALRWFVRPSYMGRFYVAFIFILIPFFIVNGILTGTGIDSPVVSYNNLENLNIRMGTIPVEDTFYGLLLILMNISIFEFLKKDASRVA